MKLMQDEVGGGACVMAKVGIKGGGVLIEMRD